ncbi:AMP-binding protein [Tistrella bauzanensis]
MGCFVNLLPVIAAPEDGDTLTTLGRRIGLELSRVLAVQDYPLSRLTADWSRAVPDRGPAPFDVVCTLEGDLAALDSADLAIATGKFPLLIGLMWQGDAAALNIEHDPARFGTAWVDRLARVLQAVIMAAAADPATPLGRLSLLDDADRALIDAVNATATSYPRDQGLATRLDAVLTADPARPVIADDDQTLDAGTLRARLGGVAAALEDAGVAPGAVVGLAVDRDLGGIIGLMGIIWAGGAYLPLATTFPIDTARRLLANAGCTVLLADDAGLAHWAALAPDITLVPLTAAMPVAAAPGQAPAPRGPEDLACILYTSGSTGEPKGVAIPQRAIARLAHGGFCRPGQTMAQTAPIAFDAISLELWAPLLNHGRVRIIPAMTMFDPPLLERCLRDGRVDVAWVTASLLNRIIDDRPRTFASLSLLLTGGEVISPGHIARLIDACPGITVLNGYGPTENGTFTTTHIVSSADLDGGPVPIGRPVANTRIHVVDDRGRPVPPGCGVTFWPPATAWPSAMSAGPI